MWVRDGAKRLSARELVNSHSWAAGYRELIERVVCSQFVLDLMKTSARFSLCSRKRRGLRRGTMSKYEPENAGRAKLLVRSCNYYSLFSWGSWVASVLGRVTIVPRCTLPYLLVITNEQQPLVRVRRTGNVETRNNGSVVLKIEKKNKRRNCDLIIDTYEVCSGKLFSFK